LPVSNYESNTIAVCKSCGEHSGLIPLYREEKLLEQNVQILPS